MSVPAITAITVSQEEKPMRLIRHRGMGWIGTGRRRRTGSPTAIRCSASLAPSAAAQGDRRRRRGDPARRCAPTWTSCATPAAECDGVVHLAFRHDVAFAGDFDTAVASDHGCDRDDRRGARRQRTSHSRSPRASPACDVGEEFATEDNRARADARPRRSGSANERDRACPGRARGTLDQRAFRAHGPRRG